MLATTMSTIAAALASAAAPMPTTATHADEQIQVALVSREDALVAGRSVELGLVLRHAPHWHTYWINPGDSGLPTTLTWEMPEGYVAGPIRWPLPQRFRVGDLTNFGYEGETLLPVRIDVPGDAKVGDRVRLAVRAKWLVCREECIPGRADLAIELPVAAEAGEDRAHAAAFEAADAATPVARDWNAVARIADGRVSIRGSGAELPSGDAVDAFVEQRRIVDNGKPALRRDGEGLVIEMKQSEYFATAPEAIDLVLRESPTRGTRIRVPLAATP